MSRGRPPAEPAPCGRCGAGVQLVPGLDYCAQCARQDLDRLYRAAVQRQDPRLAILALLGRVLVEQLENGKDAHPVGRER